MWASETVGQLIIARGVQGVSGAAALTGSLAIISESFDEERRGQAIGTWSAFTAITAGIGPVIGGWLIEQISWRAVFFINVPLALVVLAISFLRVPRAGMTVKAKAWTGWAQGLAHFGLGTLVYGLIESSRFGFGHPLVISTLVLGALSLSIFLLVEGRMPATRCCR